MADVSHFNIKIAVDSKTGEAQITQFGDKVKKTGHEIEKSSHQMGAGFSKLKLGIAAAAMAMIAFAKSSMDAYGVQRKAEKDLEATIKSTGGAAGMTAEELKKMAAELQKVTNFGDEATIKGQAMLLTFTNIGKEVFPQATEAMLNMAQKFGGGPEGMQTASIQLGKALNDPIQGVTALRRVGIQLSQQQQDQIKQFMAVNDIAGAQKVILGELDTQFGGLAKAMASPMKQLQNLFGDMKEKFGELVMKIIKPLLPVIESIVVVFMDLADALLPIVSQIGTMLIPQMEMLKSVIQILLPPIVMLVEKVFKAAAPIMEKLYAALGRLIPAFIPLIDVMTQMVEENLDMLIPLLESMVDLLVSLTPVIILAAKAQADFMRVGMAVLNAVIRPVVDAIKYIIDKGAQAADFVASIFGGGGSTKKKTKPSAEKTEPTGPKEGDMRGDEIFLNGKWVKRKKGAGVLGDGDGGDGKSKKDADKKYKFEKEMAQRTLELERALRKEISDLSDAENKKYQENTKIRLELDKATRKALAERNRAAAEKMEEKERAEMDTADRIAGIRAEMITDEMDRETALFNHKMNLLALEGIKNEEYEAKKSALVKAHVQTEWDIRMSLMDAYGAAVTSALSSLAEIFNANFEEMKLFSIAEAIINTALGVTKALGQTGFLGIAQAIAVGLAGYAQVKKIIETRPGSSAGAAPTGLAQAGNAPTRGGMAPRRLSLSGGTTAVSVTGELVARDGVLTAVIRSETRAMEGAGV